MYPGMLDAFVVGVGPKGAADNTKPAIESDKKADTWYTAVFACVAIFLFSSDKLQAYIPDKYICCPEQNELIARPTKTRAISFAGSATA